jgi:hypothetical protein
MVWIMYVVLQCIMRELYYTMYLIQGCELVFLQIILVITYTVVFSSASTSHGPDGCRVEQEKADKTHKDTICDV